MFDVLWTRWKQGHRTIRYPAGPPPELPERFAGRPAIDSARCAADCSACALACPTEAIAPSADRKLALDMGKCLFCRSCQSACPAGAIQFTRDHRLAASERHALVVSNGHDAPLARAPTGTAEGWSA